MKRVLVIEDNADNRRLLYYAFSRAGFDVMEAESGEDGAARAEAARPDLVVVDVNLPGMDGMETARTIRSRLEGECPPIVAITSYAVKGDRERILDAGCDAYFEKPIDPITIVGRILEDVGWKDP